MPSYNAIYKAFLNNKKEIIHEHHALKKAYKVIKQYKNMWCSRYSLYHSVKAEELNKCILDHRHFKYRPEKLTYLEANTNYPTIRYRKGKQKSLPIFSAQTWPEFCKNLNGKIYMCIGHRKAFFTHNPFPLHHAILLISDSRNHYAIFSFNSPKGDKDRLAIINDLTKNVSHHYKFYDELTISAQSKKQVADFFNNMEKYGHAVSFNIVTNNCYTATVFGLLKAKNLGFYLPKDYYDRLLVVLSKEQNLGVGLLTNKVLENIIVKTIDRILQTQTEPSKGYGNKFTIKPRLSAP